MLALHMIQLVFRDRLPGGCALTPLVFFFYLLSVKEKAPGLLMTCGRQVLESLLQKEQTFRIWIVSRLFC